MEAAVAGRFDVHSHLLPGIDDGCSSLEQSLECARRMVAAGYSHSFCTPHFWPSYPKITSAAVTQWVSQFQKKLDSAGIDLRVFPGGEIGLRKDLMNKPPAELPTFGMSGKYVLVDLWADRLPDFFEPTIRWMQQRQLTVILAHPERMRAVQDHPELADYFTELGVLLQGNLQCFSDPPNAFTRITAEQFLREDRYFLLGSDLHNPQTLSCRMDGLVRAIGLVGQERIDALTIHNPQKLLDRESAA